MMSGVCMDDVVCLDCILIMCRLCMDYVWTTRGLCMDDAWIMY